MPPSPSAQAWARNFALQIKCRHCGATYECEQPVVTNVKAKNTHRRHVVAFAPESCPEPNCRSLHLVTTAPSTPSAPRRTSETEV